MHPSHDMNILVLGRRIVGSALAHDLVRVFVAARLHGRGTTCATSCQGHRDRAAPHQGTGL